MSGTITQNLRLPGQYFDVESGWNHNGFRDYAPGLGRYIEPDPLGRAGSGNNLYTYAEDDPIDLDDPFGEQAVPNPTPPAPGPVLVPRTPPFIEPLPEPVNPFWILLTLLFNSQPLNMDEVKWDQRQAEHDAYKEYCRPPSLPESMDPCAQLSRLIDHTNKCIALMQARDAKWQPNRHDEDIQNLFNRLQNLKDEHNRNCAKQCK
ncbi:MAG: RHS repeat-associated core domain-containing protein [Candidatus Sulfotelmatobacter sp.]